MFEWISNNIVTIATVLVLAAVIGLALFSLIRAKKRPSGGCTGNCATCCSGCPYSSKK